MATENPRVAAYPPPKVYERLVEFKRSQGFKSDSSAIVAILEDYFFSSTSGVLLSEPLGNSKRIEDLEVKVSSLLEDVAVLKQTMSQYTRLSSGELLRAEEYLHSSDNSEYLSELPNKSSNTILDVTNESVSTDTNTSTSESQIIGADGNTQLVKSSVHETVLIGEPQSELLLGTQTAEPMNNQLFGENILINSELLSKPLESTPDFVETAELFKAELKNTNIAIGESLASVNQLVALKQTSTCEAKEFSVEFSLGDQWSEPARVEGVQNSGDPENITSEPLDTDCLERVLSVLPSDSLGELSLVVENNHSKITAVTGEPQSNLPSSSLVTDESINSLQVPLHLTGAALARRLNVSPSTIRHKKNSRNFGQWTSGHDPDGITWHFDGQKFIKKPSPNI